MSLQSAVLGAFLIIPAALWGQLQPRGTLLQDVQSLPTMRGGGITVIPLPRSEKGKPFSATATTQVERTLLDGTHVTRTTTSLEYRDVEGRVRIESSGRISPAGTPRTITIRDPVAGFMYRLDPVHRTAVRSAYQNGREQDPIDGTSRVGGRGGSPAAKEGLNSTTEDLGVAVLGGISAHGTRITTVVPAQAIGNDREFRSTSERWFSSELNLLVKSVSSDPRFGTTTFTRTNVRRSSPDPFLFDVPPDYVIVAGAAQ